MSKGMPTKTCNDCMASQTALLMPRQVPSRALMHCANGSDQTPFDQ
jgi:hypothetical protein